MRKFAAFVAGTAAAFVLLIAPAATASAAPSQAFVGKTMSAACGSCNVGF